MLEKTLSIWKGEICLFIRQSHVFLFVSFFFFFSLSLSLSLAHICQILCSKTMADIVTMITLYWNIRAGMMKSNAFDFTRIVTVSRLNLEKHFHSKHLGHRVFDRRRFLSNVSMSPWWIRLLTDRRSAKPLLQQVHLFLNTPHVLQVSLCPHVQSLQR